MDTHKYSQTKDRKQVTRHPLFQREKRARVRDHLAVVVLMRRFEELAVDLARRADNSGNSVIATIVRDLSLHTKDLRAFVNSVSADDPELMKLVYAALDFVDERNGRFPVEGMRSETGSCSALGYSPWSSTWDDSSEEE